MIINLTGKRAIVTGSTSGIGFAIARGLAEAGAAVVLNGRTQKSVDAARRRLAQQLPQAKIERVAGLAKPVAETDILVNNLRIVEPKPFGEITDEDWQPFLTRMS